MLSPLPAFALYVAGAILLIAAVRWWRREPTWLGGLFYAALATAFFLRPLLGSSIQVPSDLAYETRPWSETLATPVAVHNRRVEDTLLEQLPFHTLVRRRLLAGEAPLWSHELGTGQPLLGGRPQRGLGGGLAGGEGLGIDALGDIGPAAVVLDNPVVHLTHRDLLSRTKTIMWTGGPRSASRASRRPAP